MARSRNDLSRIFRRAVMHAKGQLPGVCIHTVRSSGGHGMCPVEGERRLCSGRETFGVSFPSIGGETASVIFVRCEHEECWHIWFTGLVDGPREKLVLLGDVFERPTMMSVTVSSDIPPGKLRPFFRVLVPELSTAPALVMEMV